MLQTLDALASRPPVLPKAPPQALPAAAVIRPAVPAAWAAAAALLVVLPNFSATPFADQYDSQRLLELAVSTALVGAATAVPAVRTAWLDMWARIPAWAVVCVAAVGVLGVLSSSTAARPVYAYAEVASFAVMGVGIVAAASAGRGGARAGLALVAVLALGGYAASVLPFHVADLAAGAPETWPERHLGFGNVRQVSHLQVWLLPLVWALAAASPAGWARAGLRAVAAVTVALMVATNGRGILAALTAGLVVAGLTVRAGRRTLLREVAVSAGCGIGVWAVLFTAGETALHRAEAGLNGRAELWTSALRMVADHPWLGVGPMHFVYTPTPFGAHPHNLVLQLASEWGIPATLIAVGLILRAGMGWLCHARRAVPADAPWMAGLTVSFAGALVYALADGFLIAPVSQILAVLVLGALLAESLDRGPMVVHGHREARPPAWGGLALAGVALPALAVLLAVAASDGPSLERRPYDLRASQVSSRGLPRFWSTGQIAGHLPPEQATRWPDPAAKPLTSGGLAVSKNGRQALTNTGSPAIPPSHLAARPAFSATPNG